MNSSLSQNFKAFFTLLFFFTSTYLAALSFSEQEQQWIHEHPTITLGADFNWPPYDFVDQQSNHVGIAADFLALISKKSGLNIIVKPDIWSKVMIDMQAGKLDGLGCTASTPEREKFLNFSAPYTQMPLGIIVQDNRNDIFNLNDLKGKSVAVNRGSYLHEWLEKNHPDIKLYLTTSNGESLEAVSFSKADAYIGNLAVADYVMKDKYLSNLKVVNNIPDMSTKVSVAIDKKNPILFSIIEKTLQSISHTERENIIQKWFSISKMKFTSTLKLTAAEERWIQEHPYVSYSEINWKPLSIIENNTMKGILNDYLERIASKTGIRFVYKPSDSWPEVLEKFKNHEIDMVPGIGDEEAHLGIPTQSFTRFPFVLITKNDQPYIDSLDELENSAKVIAVPKYWTSYNHLVKERPNIKIIPTQNIIEALELVRSGKAYAVLAHLAIAMHYVGTYFPNTLHIAGKTELNFNHQLLLHDEDAVLLSIINKALSSISEKEHLEIKNRWLHVEVKAAKDFSFLLKYAVLVAALFILFLFWNRKLSREIEERKRIEEALHVEKENFRVLFDKVSNGNLILQDGQFVTCNAAALKILGLKEKKELLQTTPDFWSPSLQPDGRFSDEKVAEMIQICKQKGNHRFEWVHKDIHDHHFWVDTTLTKISYQQHDAIYVIWHDISTQKALEDSLKVSQLQTQLLIDNIPVYIIVTDYDGNFLRVNPNVLKDFNLDAKTITKYNTIDFYANPSDRDHLIKLIKTNGRVDKEIIRFKHPEKELNIMVSMLPIEYDNTPAFLSIGVDLSERIELEEALKKAKETADMANHSKSEFLANMSHEIRTPMNAIIGFTELLNEQLSEPRLKSYVKTIQSAGNTLLMLINDILDLSKIEAGKMQLQKKPTNLHHLFKEIGAVFSINIRNKGLELLIDVQEDIPQSVLIDDIRLRQILFNLIGNAVKFTQHGFIKLQLKTLHVDDHQSKIDLLIKVQDSGVGIPEDQLEKIFNVFEQKEGQDNRQFGGTGLGLSISKRLCEMMDGKLSVSSIEGEGSVFSLEIYGIDIASFVSENIHDEIPKDKDMDIVFKPATILVVDDIEDNRELVIKNFEGTLIDVKCATNGQEALTMTQEEHFDLILMDIRMPVMDGYEAAEAIKNTQDTPIIALTASVMLNEFEQKRSEHFDAYLRKPVLRRDLFKTVSLFLEHDLFIHKEDDTAAFVLSERATHNLPLILDALCDDIRPLHVKALHSNKINDIKVLATTISTLANRYDIDILKTYASQIFEAIDAFDIAELQKLLQNYDSFEKQISSAQ
jgi:PAS domain S-box-containing protein